MKRSVHKRGQISLFILLGVVLLITVFLLFYIQSLAAREGESTTRIVDGQQNLLAPKEYIETCVQNEVLTILESAQDILTTNDAVLYDNTSYALLYTQEGGTTPFTFFEVANYLDENLVAQLPSCIDTSIYENQGLSVTRGSLKTKTTIGADVISVVLDFPLKVEGSELSFDLSTHRVIVDVPYGRMILAINEMVNSEITTGWFDQVAYMHKQENVLYDEPLLWITKQKPYPNTVYDFSLSYLGEELSLAVGIEGVDTAFARSSGVSYQFTPVSTESCCQFDSMCSQGTSEGICFAKQGFFTDVCSCQQPQDAIAQPTTSFQTCSGIESGSSWCEYHPGVGGRFYRNTCVDGVVEIESCRDFKEEVCVEENDVAYCRPNTAQSCFECTDESCCSQSDCAYIGEGICVPEAPLGFKFWDSTQEYCQSLYTKITQQSDISSFTAREREFLCSSISDCGNTFNYYGDFSRETIDGEKLKDVLTDIGVLSYDTPLSSVDFFSLPENKVTISKQFAQTVTHLQDFLDITESEFLDPKNDLTFAQTISQVCQPFYPADNTCELCGENRPCSEYACKSLGSQCQYILVDGTHQCLSTNPVSDDFRISGMTVEDNFVNRATLDSFSGFSLDQKQSVSKTLDVEIQTTKSALCKPSYLPGISFGELGSSDLTNGEYNTTHHFTIRFINDLPIFGRLSSYFQAQSYADLVSQIVDFSFQVEKLQRKYPFIDRFQLPFAKAVSQFVRVTTDLNYDSLVTQLLERAAQKSFSVFFACIDQSGAQLAEQSFISFSLEHSCVEPITFTVKGDAHPYVNEIISLQTQTFSECRFDTSPVAFEIMNHTFDCPNTIYDVTEDGYVCDANVANMMRNSTNLPLYVICRERVKEPIVFDLNFTFVPKSQTPLHNSILSDNASNTTISNNTNQTENPVLPSDGAKNRISQNTDFQFFVEDNTSALLAKNITTDIYARFDRPAICSQENNVSIGCSDELCFIPKENVNAFNASVLSFTCETIPESLSCLEYYAQPRETPLTEVILKKVTPYSIDEISITNSAISFTVYSAISRDIVCQYKIEDGPFADLEIQNPSGTNVFFKSNFAQPKTGLVKIACIDAFGIKQEKSGFILE